MERRTREPYVHYAKAVDDSGSARRVRLAYKTYCQIVGSSWLFDDWGPRTKQLLGYFAGVSRAESPVGHA